MERILDKITIERLRGIGLVTANEVVFHVRFHIMPDINITETNNKRSVIIKTNNKNIWIFKSSANLVLEESIYVD